MQLRKALPKDLDFIKETEMHPANADYIGHWSWDEYENALYDKDYSLEIIEEENSPVGFVLMSGLKERDNSLCLLRIAINEKGKGVGTLCLQQLIKRTFREWNANRLWLDVRTFNKRAIAIYEKLGFVREGTLREASLTEQGYCDVHIYAILKSEFPQLRWLKKQKDLL